MLKYRILTALILIPLVLWALFHSSPLLFAIISGAILILAAWEWTVLMDLNTLTKKILYVSLLSIVSLLSYQFPEALLYLACVWWLVAIFVVINFPKRTALLKNSLFIRGIIGLLIIIPCWLGLLKIRSAVNGPQWVLFLLLIIWLADSAAYFAGRALGKRKLAPQVSPGKSIEGAIGALITIFLFALAGCYWFKISAIHWPLFILFCLVILCVSIIGDLTESLFKRMRGVKDSGTILPGHGGVLDRLDSLLAAAPVFAVGMKLFM